MGCVYFSNVPVCACAFMGRSANVQFLSETEHQQFLSLMQKHPPNTEIGLLHIFLSHLIKIEEINFISMHQGARKAKLLAFIAPCVSEKRGPVVQ